MSGSRSGSRSGTRSGSRRASSSGCCCHYISHFFNYIIDLSVAALGQQHPYTLNAMGNYANSLAKLGHTEEAAELEKQRLDLSVVALGQQFWAVVRHADFSDGIKLSSSKGTHE